MIVHKFIKFIFLQKTSMLTREFVRTKNKSELSRMTLFRDVR